MRKRKQSPKPDENAPPPRPHPDSLAEKLRARMDESDEIRKRLSADQRGRLMRSLSAVGSQGVRTRQELQLVQDQLQNSRDLAQARDGSRGQAQKNRQRRLEGDKALVGKVAKLINAGEPTKTVASKLGIGLDRAKRLRAMAVDQGLVRGRRR